jgi:hypothetical protein
MAGSAGDPRNPQIVVFADAGSRSERAWCAHQIDDDRRCLIRDLAG